MSANGIAHLPTREARQKAKLDLAAAKRAASAAYRDNPVNADNRNTYDMSQLPTQYADDDIYDNPNPGGLVLGRPWVGTYAAGIYQGHYNLYWNENVAFFNTATLLGSAIVNAFVIPSEATNHSEQYLGYFRPDYTGTWTFTLSSDDSSAVWIGDYAASGYTIGNALTTASYGSNGTNTIELVEGKLYAFRLMFGNGGGPGNLSLSYSHTGQSTTTDFTDKLFYNVATNGI